MSMTASLIALVFGAHLVTGFVFGFVVSFFALAIHPSAGLLLGSPALLLSAWALGRWLYGRKDRPRPIDWLVASTIAALGSLLTGGLLGLILSLMISLFLVIGYRSARREATINHSPETDRSPG
jgi:lysylphosphatidylglycerol synthetase-like protein (DUF2156 family)